MVTTLKLYLKVQGRVPPTGKGGFSQTHKLRDPPVDLPQLIFTIAGCSRFIAAGCRPPRSVWLFVLFAKSCLVPT